MGITPGSIPGAGGDSNVELNPTADLDVTDSLPVADGTPSVPDDTAEPEAGAVDKPKPGTEGVEDAQSQDGRVIPQWMRELKEKNPDAYKKAKSDFFEIRDRRTVHPTVQAAREEHDLVQSVGGREGVARLQEDSTFFKTAAGQFLKGDPAFVQDLWSEDPIAAALHVAPMLEQFRQKDESGYKSTIARIWDNELKQVNFGPALEDLIKAINAGDKKTAAEITQSIDKWHQSILDTSRKAEDPRVKTLLAERASRQDTQQKTEHESFLKTYRTDAVNTVVTEGAKVFDSFFKGYKISPDDRNDLLREAFRIANGAVESDKSFVEQRDKHLERGDSHSALQLTKSRFARELPEAVKRVARRYGMISRTSPAAPAKPGEKVQPTGQKPDAGWVTINVRPQAEEIDRNRTSNDDIISGKAILKDGRKVSWAHLKKASAA